MLSVLAHASWRLLPWAWHLTLVVYGIGVVGSLWQVRIGIEEGWTAAVVNAAVVAYAATPGVPRAYKSRPRRGRAGMRREPLDGQFCPGANQNFCPS